MNNNTTEKIARIVYGPPPLGMVRRVENVLCLDGVRRLATVRGQAYGQFFAAPASVQVGKKSVSGFIAPIAKMSIEDPDDFCFVSYTSRKNGALLPGVPEPRYLKKSKERTKDRILSGG